jgi:hypothetical protein
MMKRRISLLALPLLSIAACMDMSDQDPTEGTSSQGIMIPADRDAQPAPRPTVPMALVPEPAASAGSHLLHHACTSLGTSPTTGVQAVVCADLYEEIDTSGTARAGMIVSGMCQDTHKPSSDPTSYVQCSDIKIDFGPFVTGVGDNGTESEAVCGHQNGACPTPRAFSREAIRNVPIPSGSCSDSWGVIFSGVQAGGWSYETSIVLPTVNPREKFTLHGNFSTGHFKIGASCT